MGLIRIIDIEACGTERSDAVVEFGWTDLDSETLEIGPSRGFLCGVECMPPETRAVHHIRLDDVAGLPRYDRWLVYERAARDGVACFAAHSAEFEAQHILGSIPLICTYKAALRLWPDAPSHKNFGLLYWLEDQGLVEYSRRRAFPAHRAQPDSYATAHVLAAMLRAGTTGADLMSWTRQPALLPRCPIGDWRGRPWAECDTGFLEWILRKIWDREDVRYCAQMELDRREMADE